MKRIQQYEINVPLMLIGSQVVQVALPRGAQVLNVGVTWKVPVYGANVCTGAAMFAVVVWVLADTEAVPEPRAFHILTELAEIDDKLAVRLRYVGAFDNMHVFEEVPASEASITLGGRRL